MIGGVADAPAKQAAARWNERELDRFQGSVVTEASADEPQERQLLFGDRVGGHIIVAY